MKHIIYALLLLVCIGSSNAATITGTVSDYENDQPISLVTVMVEGTGRSMPCNDVGQYRLLLEPGSYRLKFSHVTHYSEWVDVEVADSAIVLDVALRPALIELRSIRVYENSYDPAQEIIIEAIRHKEELLSQIQSYKCDAYTRETIHKTTKDDSSIILGIVESQLECLWKQPDQYKEIIIARQQTANVDQVMNLSSIERIPNFNMNRISFYQYSIVSPTAKDALEYYNYYLLDTIFIDSQRVFRLEFEPKNDTDPLGFGTIDIADSTFAVVGLEGELSKSVFVPFLKDFHYSQHFSKFQDKFWMPTEIRIKYRIPPLGPFVYGNKIAALHNYSFDTVMAEGAFDYVLEVAANADDIDSATWNSGQLVPLTPFEKRGYERIDSIASIPPPLYKKALNGVTWLLTQTMMNYDLFHFSRVEGAYLGYGHYWFEPIPRLDVDIKTGYAFARKYWQHRYGVYYLLNDRSKLYAGVTYRDEIKRHLSILTSPGHNPTVSCLFGKVDIPDYYHEKGFGMFLGLAFPKKTRMYLIYRDYQQSSEVKNTDYSIFRKDKEFRSNPAIADGELRSFTARIKYDSRNLIRIKGRDATLQTPLSTQFKVEVEIASPKLVKNDFDFIKYSLHFKRTGHTPLPGVTTTEIFIGGSNKTLPPQKYFSVGFSYKLLEGMSFRTLGGEDVFSGNQTAAIYFSHNFGTWIFKKSGLPLIKHIPLSLSVHGGAFWTDFRNQTIQPGDDLLETAQRAYSEIGFRIGRMPPLNLLHLDFTWQLSNYNTNHFGFRLGFSM